MTISAIGLDNYDYSLEGDKGEVKTIFTLSPLSQFEFIRYGEVFGEAIGTTGGGDLDMVKVMGSKKLEDALSNFFGDKLVRVQNIEINGKISNVDGKDFDLNWLPIHNLVEILANALNQANPSEEESGN